jgi:hypothetical protein
VSRDGALALVDADGRLAIHRDTGDVELQTSGATVLVAAWSPDGARLYTADADGVIVVWEHGARALVVGDAGSGVATALAVTADGRWLLAGTDRGAVRALPVTDDSMRERACSVLRAFSRPGC